MEFADRYSAVDRLLHRLAFATAGVQVDLGDIEDRLYRKQLADTPVERPVFITALARAGTTLLLQLISGLDEFASHCYRDMPFVLLPLMWRSMSKAFRQNAAPSERAHGDGILVDLDSAEAFEEMLWKAKWPEHYLRDRIVPWVGCDDPEAAEYLTRHLKKMIRLRQERPEVLPRYLSKNNGNIARVACVKQCWPDAIIVVPVREPVQHAASLLRQHRRFLEIEGRDRFVREYLKGIGHFDFGSNLKPIDFDGWLSKAQHRDPQTIGYWLEYWGAAYGYLLNKNASSVHFLAYDRFCAEPDAGLRWLGETLGIADRAKLTAERGAVRLPPVHNVELKDVAPTVLAKAEEIYREIVGRCDFGASGGQAG
jgi:hypothetical protein